jgi:PAP2 superfamily
LQDGTAAASTAQRPPGRLRSLGSAIAASARSGLVREALLVTAAMLAYFGIRNLTVGSREDALGNAEHILEAEDALGIAWEDTIQASVVGSDTLVTLANWVYIWGHWPVILSAAIVLYIVRRDSYFLLRNALFVSGAIGFVMFALVPVAPPRLLDLGLVDTVTDQSNAYRALQPPGLTNQYAAFPSLHLGWNLAVGIVLFLTTAHLAVRGFALVSPLAMGFAVMATANHFLLDVVAGALVVLVGLAVAGEIERRRDPATLAGRGLALLPGFRARGGAATIPGRPPGWQPHRRPPRSGAARRRARRG